MDRETLGRLAEQSRLDCTPAELEAFLPDMADILVLMDTIQDFSGLPEELEAPLSLDRLREDGTGSRDPEESRLENGAPAGSQTFWTPRIV